MDLKQRTCSSIPGRIENIEQVIGAGVALDSPSAGERSGVDGHVPGWISQGRPIRRGASSARSEYRDTSAGRNQAKRSSPARGRCDNVSAGIPIESAIGSTAGDYAGAATAAAPRDNLGNRENRTKEKRKCKFQSSLPVNPWTPSVITTKEVPWPIQ